MANATEQSDTKKTLDTARRGLAEFVAHMGTHVQANDPMEDAIACTYAAIVIHMSPDERAAFLSLAAYELAKLGWKP